MSKALDIAKSNCRSVLQTTANNLKYQIHNLQLEIESTPRDRELHRVLRRKISVMEQDLVEIAYIMERLQ